MNWTDVKTPPDHSKDVLLAIDDEEKYWIESKYEDGQWKNRLGEPIHPYQLSKATHYSEVKLPN